jgi:hypothetical protein
LQSCSVGCRGDGDDHDDHKKRRKKRHAGIHQHQALRGGIRRFHTFHKTKSGQRAVVYQGIVRARIEGGLYLVQYFEWFAGSPNTMELVRVEDMLNWQFYEDTEHMSFWYEHHYHKPDDADTAAEV